VKQAIYKFDVKYMPVALAISHDITNVHNIGPKERLATFAKIPLTAA
jgi:hypothetical protein